MRHAVHRRRSIALAVSTCMGAIIATAAPASAEPNPPGCPKGYFCVYAGINQQNLLLRTAGNWSGVQEGAISFFNNGYRFPGADHVSVTYGALWYTGVKTKCLHYNPGPGQYKMNLPQATYVLKIVWRGEC